jgi:hypothetical protein
VKGLWRRYVGFLAYAISGEARAYGFTLVIWSTGATCIARHGLPGEWEIILFVLGALTAFGVNLLVAFPDHSATYHRSQEPSRWAWGQFHVASILLGIGGGWLGAAFVGGSLAYFTASLGAVLAFELVLSVEIMLTTPRRGQPETGEQRAGPSGHLAPQDRGEGRRSA